MDQLDAVPTIIIDDGATEAQRHSLLEFESLARGTESGLIEAALELQAKAKNLMPLVERVTREELKRVYVTWEQIRETSAYSVILGFDDTTEDLIEADDEHSRLLSEKNIAVVQRRQSGQLVRPGKVSVLEASLRQQDEALRDAIMRRKFIIFAGRVALKATHGDSMSTAQTMKSPA